MIIARIGRKRLGVTRYPGAVCVWFGVNLYSRRTRRIWIGPKPGWARDQK